jgi:hypothetical protein
MDNNQNFNQQQPYDGSQQPYNYGQQPQYNYSPQPQVPTSGKAIGSMVCGILSIPCLCVYIVPGFILAIVAIALAASAKKDAPIKNKGMATAGKVCGWISIILVILLVIAVVAVVVLGVGASYMDYSFY